MAGPGVGVNCQEANRKIITTKQQSEILKVEQVNTAYIRASP